MLFTNETSTNQFINAPAVVSTEGNSTQTLDKSKILWMEESSDNVSSYGPFSVRPLVGASYISFPFTTEGTT